MSTRIHAALQEIAGALYRLGERATAERVFELIGTTDDTASVLAAVRVPWQDTADAKLILKPLCDATGAVEGCIVRLDARNERHDGGPTFRQAWFDSSRDTFVCSATGNTLPNVTGWALARSEDE